MIRIYVGNLPYDTTAEELRAVFEAHGTVSDTAIIMDRQTGRSRGFGFVEMSDDSQGQQAIEALNGTEIGERRVVVNEARPQRGRGGGGGGYR